MAGLSKTCLMQIFICVFFIEANAQNAIPASGGNAIGSGGSLSYTAGQMTYSPLSGSGGIAEQGIQQAFEISVITSLPEASDVELKYSVFPNPTRDLLNLKADRFSERQLTYWLYGPTGNIVETGEVFSESTYINMTERVAGVYYLRIVSDNKEIKSFKIIKY